MAFSHYFLDVNLWALDLNEKGQPVGGPKSLLVSSKTERCPRFSPDGKRIAFESNRSGKDEIWVCSSDGTNCQSIASFDGPHVGSPAWSPDGEWIAFDGNPEGRIAVYVVRAEGGRPRRLTDGGVPMWSGDGKWIYFSRGSVYKIPVPGGDAVPITRSRGTSAAESADGRFLYFSDSPNWVATALKRIPLAGGEEEQVLPVVSGRNFVPVPSGIFYLIPGAPGEYRLEFLDFATQATRVVHRIPASVSAGLTLSADRRRIIWTQVDREGSDLMLVDNFR